MTKSKNKWMIHTSNKYEEYFFYWWDNLAPNKLKWFETNHQKREAYRYLKGTSEFQQWFSKEMIFASRTEGVYFYITHLVEKTMGPPSRRPLLKIPELKNNREKMLWWSKNLGPKEIKIIREGKVPEEPIFLYFKKRRPYRELIGKWTDEKEFQEKVCSYISLEIEKAKEELENNGYLMI